MRRSFVHAAFIACLLFVGCAEETPEPEIPDAGSLKEPSLPEGCDEPDLKIVEHVLAIPVERAGAVTTEMDEGPADLQEAPTYIAAEVKGGEAVWVFGKSALEDGGGIAVPADPEAAKASDIGTYFDPVELSIGPGDSDYDLALECLDAL